MGRPMVGEIRDGVFVPLGEVRSSIVSERWFPTVEANCWRCGRGSQGHRLCEGCKELLHGEGE